MEEIEDDMEELDASGPSWAQRLTISLASLWHCSRRFRYSSVQRDNSAVTVETYAAVTSTTCLEGSGIAMVRKVSSK